METILMLGKCSHQLLGEAMGPGLAPPLTLGSHPLSHSSCPHFAQCENGS